MKAEVKLSKDPNKPFRPGIWLNEHEVWAIIDRFPEGSWLRADLIEKFEQARQQADRQIAAYCAGKDATVLPL